jgi:hypothetical protein
MASMSWTEKGCVSAGAAGASAAAVNTIHIKQMKYLRMNSSSLINS